MSRASGTLVARSVSKSYGETLVLDRVSVAVTPGSRVGIVGPNGIGKTTLLRVLASVETADHGTVALEPPSATIAYLPQEGRVATRSGGEAARAKLEAVMSEGADVVLLDEPTNDLDFAGLELLERFVESHRGGLVAVSHDRVFLELMTRIIEFDAETRRVREFAGGWSAFEAERRLARERHQDAYRRSAAERRRVEEQARRMREWEQRGYGQGRKRRRPRT